MIQVEILLIAQAEEEAYLIVGLTLCSLLINARDKLGEQMWQPQLSSVG
jgi:hypothetical protein